MGPLMDEKKKTFEDLVKEACNVCGLLKCSAHPDWKECVCGSLYDPAGSSQCPRCWKRSQRLKLLWMVATCPVFFFFVPIATVVSAYDGRDVFPAAHQWTHGLLFGHRWGPHLDFLEYRACRFCGKTKRIRKEDWEGN